MKRTILVIAIIALVAVAVFGGQALAAKPSGGSMAIETDENLIAVLDDYITTSINYPQVRHISLTMLAWGLEEGDSVAIWHWMPNDPAYIDIITSYKYQTYEFDSDNFEIIITDNGGDIPTSVGYYITTTYER